MCLQDAQTKERTLSLSLSHTHTHLDTHTHTETNAQNFKAHADGGPTPDLSTSDRRNSEFVPSVSLAIFAVDHV